MWCSVSFRLARANLVQDETQPSYKNITGRFIVPLSLQTRQITSYIRTIHSFPFYLALYFSVAGSSAYSLQCLRQNAMGEKKKSVLIHHTLGKGPGLMFSEDEWLQ